MREGLRLVFLLFQKGLNFLLGLFGLQAEIKLVRTSNGKADHFFYLRPIDFEIGELSPRVNLLIPYMARDESIFAGTRMVLALGASLVNANIPIRFLVTDELYREGIETKALEQFIQYFPETKDQNIKIEYVQRSNGKQVKVNKDDLFLASAWWTVYQMRQLFDDTKFSFKRLFYLIQDFEPGFYPWGTDFALAYQTYSFDVLPIFSTSELRDYFFSIYGNRFSREETAVYLPEISKKIFYPKDLPSYKRQGIRRLFCYYRPSIPRNMYLLLVESLKAAVSEGYFSEEKWEFWSGGEDHSPIPLGRNLFLQSKGKMSLMDYANFLKDCDLGISLMCSPHPSYPPFEMAQSGLVTITNRFLGKDLSKLSKNILSCDPEPNALKATIQKAIQRVSSFEERIKNSSLPFPDNYLDCFSEAVQFIKTFRTFP
ncbi:hypothetical protein LPTSP4_03540 [Leptospira ryugenii]|uniref:Glycosyltransferase, group 1 family protein n=1 Tax=Leptospira ryugenii TaxID=1917863 RepID=A0A2P2DW42_9LEPT|nr:hypothetical protein [Leptospira ryugenii]GBF48854.1 hypothetical protein LPTSP4_03540 [Leptospira ryugenii]